MAAGAGLTVEGVYTAYDKADVLEDVTLAAAAGRITCLLGANGSGKTTLIRSILALTPPRSGRIALDGVEITGLPTHRIVAHGIACIPEGRRLFPKLTVDENLRLGAYQVPDEATVRRRLDEVFEVFPVLAERRGQVAGTLSGGEQAMVSIGRGLMRAPRLLLIDEPSLGLAPLFVKESFRIIQGLGARGITIFLVEQNVRQTLEISDYGYVLSKGQVVAAGTPDELRSDREVVNAYFGGGHVDTTG